MDNWADAAPDSGAALLLLRPECTEASAMYADHHEGEGIHGFFT